MKTTNADDTLTNKRKAEEFCVDRIMTQQQTTDRISRVGLSRFCIWMILALIMKRTEFAINRVRCHLKFTISSR